MLKLVSSVTFSFLYSTLNEKFMVVTNAEYRYSTSSHPRVIHSTHSILLDGGNQENPNKQLFSNKYNKCTIQFVPCTQREWQTYIDSTLKSIGSRVSVSSMLSLDCSTSIKTIILCQKDQSSDTSALINQRES